MTLSPLKQLCPSVPCTSTQENLSQLSFTGKQTKKVTWKYGEGSPAVPILRFSLAIHHSSQQQDAKAAAAFYLLGRTTLVIAERAQFHIVQKI